MANAEQVFRAKAPGIMVKLLSDFPITVEDAAAIVGNLGHESLGFTAMQEFKPTVPGSKGGWGWAQWTGPRRRAFEAWCKRTGHNPSSDDANYAWLFLELKGIEGTEGKAIGKTVAAKGLDAKVEAFEKAFLRAGVKHYPSRNLWAKRALEAYRASKGGVSASPAPTTRPDPSPPAYGASDKAPTWAIIAIILLGLAIAGLFFIRF